MEKVTSMTTIMTTSQMMNSKLVALALRLKIGESATAATLLEESSAVFFSTSVLGVLAASAAGFDTIPAAAAGPAL